LNTIAIGSLRLSLFFRHHSQLSFVTSLAITLFTIATTNIIITLPVTIISHITARHWPSSRHEELRHYW